MNNVTLPYSIGDTIYVVENYNEHFDKCEHFTTKYNTEIKIKKYEVEGFIITKDGIYLTEDGWDGFNIFEQYHTLELENYDNCKIFNTLKEAEEFVKSIVKVKVK